ncbi:hypothetical protein COL922a_003429 [Colletotrichum nupharicola]|nr:hypothetical protein COL922a_003429 [Colletotrichum nupharicola]
MSIWVVLAPSGNQSGLVNNSTSLQRGGKEDVQSRGQGRFPSGQLQVGQDRLRKSGCPGSSTLFELSSSLPHQPEASDEPSRYSMTSSPEEGSAMMTPFPVDEMFKLSRHFAEILAEMAPIEDASPASDMERHQPSKGLDSLADPATCLFILSTYVRLLDMYQKVFSCIHFQLGHLQPASLFQSWKLPGVTVGSFAVDSTPSLQMSLTIQLAEEFLLQMRRAASSLDPTLRSAESPAGRTLDATSMFSGVVDVSFQALKRQEESLGQELKDLRKDMESFLDG